MPGISVSKICVPFGGGGINWSSYWATLILETIYDAILTEDNQSFIIIEAPIEGDFVYYLQQE